jgi:hypothetical protein
VLPLLKFTVMRLALFVAALGLLILLGASQLGALLGAAVISFLLSYVLLRRPRQQLAEQIAARVDRTHPGPATPAEEDAALEDAADEARRTTAPPAE